MYFELSSSALGDKDLTVKQCQTCFHYGTNLQLLQEHRFSESCIPYRDASDFIHLSDKEF